MRRVYLVRHAATEWSGTRLCGTTDLPLSPAGRAQADRLAARLVDAGISATAVRSSPARRALETAQPLALALGAHLEVDARLREADFGLAEGCAFDEVERVWPTIARALLAEGGDIDWPAGERASELRDRVAAVARDLEDVGEENLVLVTHGGPIRCLVARLGLDVDAKVGPAEVLVLERGPTWRTGDPWSATVDDAKGAPVR